MKLQTSFSALLIIMGTLGTVGNQSQATVEKGIFLYQGVPYNRGPANVALIDSLGVGIVAYQLWALDSWTPMYGNPDSVRYFNPDSLAPDSAKRWLRIMLTEENFDWRDSTFQGDWADWMDYVRAVIEYHSGRKPYEDNGTEFRPFTKYFQFMNEPVYALKHGALDVSDTSYYRTLLDTTYRFANHLIDSLNAVEPFDEMPTLVWPGIGYYPDMRGEPIYNSFGERLVEMANSFHSAGIVDYFSFHCYPQGRSKNDISGAGSVLKRKHSFFVDTLGLNMGYFIGETAFPMTHPNLMAAMGSFSTDTTYWCYNSDCDSVEINPSELIGEFLDSCFAQETQECSYADIDNFIWNHPCILNHGFLSSCNEGEFINYLEPQAYQIDPLHFDYLDSTRVALMDTVFNQMSQLEGLLGFMWWAGPEQHEGYNYHDAFPELFSQMIDIDLRNEKILTQVWGVFSARYSGLQPAGMNSRSLSTDFFANFDFPSSGLEDDSPASLPIQPFLRDIFPNPFNAQTNISFGLPEAGKVKLTIYNLMGQKVGTPLNSGMEAGLHTVVWDGSEFSSGIYFARLITPGRTGSSTDERAFTKKMVLLK